MPPRLTEDEIEQRRAAERKLQVGGSLLLGLVVLMVIVLRAGVHNIFLPGWWRLW